MSLEVVFGAEPVFSGVLSFNTRFTSRNECASQRCLSKKENSQNGSITVGSFGALGVTISLLQFFFLKKKHKVQKRVQR